MLKFEGKIISTKKYDTPSDSVRIDGEINGRRCRITIEADGIARDLAGLYGVDQRAVPIRIGSGEEL